MNTGSAPNLRVHLSGGADPVDEAIAERLLQCLFQGTLIVRERIKVTVVRGQVTLSGDVALERDRASAEQIVSRLPGVVGVTNLVTVQREEWTPHGTAETSASYDRGAAYGRDAERGDVPGRIEALVERDAEIGGTEITITAMAGKVTLRGTVASWRERDLAERVAWSAPGVTEIDDQLSVISLPAVP